MITTAHNRPPQVGDRIWLRGCGLHGEILAFSESRRGAFVRIWRGPGSGLAKWIRVEEIAGVRPPLNRRKGTNG